jgi:hypothetical protein
VLSKKKKPYQIFQLKENKEISKDACNKNLKEIKFKRLQS